MKTRFLRLGHSRQLVVIAGTTFLFVAAIAAVLYPAHQGRTELANQLQKEQLILLQVRRLGERYRALSQAGAGVSGSSELSAAVERSLQGQAFQPARMQVNGDNGLQISLDRVAFGDVLTWLQELETTPGMLIADFNATQATEGTVNITIGLEGSR